MLDIQIHGETILRINYPCWTCFKTIDNNVDFVHVIPETCWTKGMLRPADSKDFIIYDGRDTDYKTRQYICEPCFKKLKKYGSC